MKITDLKEDFLNKKISKAEYIKSMYEEWHSVLFDYSSFLKDAI